MKIKIKDQIEISTTPDDRNAEEQQQFDIDKEVVTTTILKTVDGAVIESSERVTKTKVPLIKAIGVEKETDLLSVRSYESSVDYILLDSKSKESGHLKGGRGISFDWNIIKGLIAKNLGF